MSVWLEPREFSREVVLHINKVWNRLVRTADRGRRLCFKLGFEPAISLATFWIADVWFVFGELRQLRD